ncbi:MAG: hypothetical protein ACM3SV_12520 [Betaproteobacteria bacterium]
MLNEKVFTTVREMTMKKLVLALSLGLSALFAVAQVAQAADDKKKDTQAEKTKDTFTQGKSGEAKDALEKSAGKKTDDVKVPDVPKPTPVK